MYSLFGLILGVGFGIMLFGTYFNKEYVALFGFAGLILGSFMDTMAKRRANNSSATKVKAKDIIKCPKCAEDIKKEALICKHCKSEIA